EEVGEPETGTAEGRPHGQTIHRYGRVRILAEPEIEAAETAPPRVVGEPPGGLNEVERLGLEALQLRLSDDYRSAKQRRPRDGEEWDMPDCTTVVHPPDLSPGVRAEAAAPTSSYLEGTVAVGIVVVQGPTDDLRFTDGELVKVVAEVQ